MSSSARISTCNASRVRLTRPAPFLSSKDLLPARSFSTHFFFFNDPATTEIYTRKDTLSLHDALPISDAAAQVVGAAHLRPRPHPRGGRGPARARLLLARGPGWRRHRDERRARSDRRRPDRGREDRAVRRAGARPRAVRGQLTLSSDGPERPGSGASGSDGCGFGHSALRGDPAPSVLPKTRAFSNLKTS